ncbi:hypothetical protein ACJMK2_034524 [Sinanodonta woodiana]|uniref:DJ-1/PfpI domain-containing protein n=1 Tax=Sinanodonta woodiana TaxID=1069815 RepID=A0ABD3WU09_SINWO
MTKKVIIVVTNHDQLGTGKTGWYLPEVAHPHHVFTKAGYEVTFVSPKGGKAPMDPSSEEAFKSDPICQEFLKSTAKKLENTVSPASVKPSDFKGLMYAGGHGPMFDMPTAKNVADLALTIYDKGGVLGAVCHGTVGFVPIKLKNGSPLVKGANVTCFTNSEEEAVKLVEAMPFLLETKLRELGANFVAAENFKANVQVSGRLVSGQNPASSTPMAEEMVKLMNK